MRTSNNRGGKPVPQSESDTNLTGRRAAWQARALDGATRAVLAEDERYFLRQSVSTPCLNAIAKAEGIWIEDMAGRRYMDFHGNNVHHIGYGHPRLKRAIAEQMDALPFAPRRYTCEPAVALARKLRRSRPSGSSKVLFTTGGSDAIEVADQDRPRRDRALQDAVVLGRVPRRRLRRRGAVGGEALFRSGASARSCRAPSTSRPSAALAVPTARRARKHPARPARA